MVTQIAHLNMIKTADNSGSVFGLLYPRKPFVKDMCCFNFIFQTNSVAQKRQAVNKENSSL